MTQWQPAEFPNLNSSPLNNELLHYIQEILTGETDFPSSAHKESITELADYIGKQIRSGEEVNITVICTHNSRRSHMGQLWLAAAASYFGIKNIKTYSGGTEQTAFNPRAVASLQRAGFQIDCSDPEVKNPVYEARWLSDKTAEPLVMFSKKYDHEFNPDSDFIAIMVCGEADAACPIVSGAAQRSSLPFEDPKQFDGTEVESAEYDKTCRLIAAEMLVVMKWVKERL